MIQHIHKTKSKKVIYNSASLTLLPFCFSQANNKLQSLHIVAQAMDLLAPFFWFVTEKSKNYLTKLSHFPSSFPFTTTTTTTNLFIPFHQLFACANATFTTSPSFHSFERLVAVTPHYTRWYFYKHIHTTRLNPFSYCYPINHPCDNNNTVSTMSEIVLSNTSNQYLADYSAGSMMSNFNANMDSPSATSSSSPPPVTFDGTQQHQQPPYAYQGKARVINPLLRSFVFIKGCSYDWLMG